jgi:hypothetical protein
MTSLMIVAWVIVIGGLLATDLLFHYIDRKYNG